MASPTTCLPSPRSFLTSLFNTLALIQPPIPLSSTSDQPHTKAQPLSRLDDNAKKVFVTLHCLFPSELLPALDLLDRRLITRLVLRTGADVADNSAYYVRSASSHRAAVGQCYEVRLWAWNCTCAAFTFASLGTAEFGDSSSREEEAAEEGAQRGWRFGGAGLWAEEVIPPVCKHLLACALVETSALLRGEVDERVTERREEMAGWAAGWNG